MPERGDSSIRVSRSTVNALNAVTKKAPRFSTAGLADALLSEACAALTGKGPFELPTLVYLAQLLGVNRDTPDTATRLARLESLLPFAGTESLVLNEAPPKTATKG